MAEGWTAVAREVNSRAAELGLTQRELSERSGVSLATLREIQQDKIRRRRNPRTLEALSVALERHPHYLDALLGGTTPPGTGRVPQQPDPVLVALNTIVREIRGLRAQIGTLSSRLDSVVRSENGKKPDTT